MQEGEKEATKKCCTGLRLDSTRLWFVSKGLLQHHFYTSSSPPSAPLIPLVSNSSCTPAMTTSSISLGASAAPTNKLTHQAPFESIIRDKPSQKLIISLSLRLRRGQISGPEAVSEATAKTLRSVVSSAKYGSMQELIDIIKAAGRQLQLSQPQSRVSATLRGGSCIC